MSILFVLSKEVRPKGVKFNCRLKLSIFDSGLSIGLSMEIRNRSLFPASSPETLKKLVNNASQDISHEPWEFHRRGLQRD